MSDLIQIPAGDFGPIIDGHAWWIVDQEPYGCLGCGRVLTTRTGCPGRTLGVAHITRPLDRTCDTCDGRGDVEGDVKPHRVEGGSLSCHYCRHTFTFNMMRDSGPFVCSCSRSVEARRTPCPADCIDGRHTFTVEVEPGGCGRCDPWTAHLDGEAGFHGETCASIGCDQRTMLATHRLSIVPRMILPLVQVDEHNTVGHYIVRVNDRWFRIDNSSLPVTLHGEVFDLPSGARPGRWAVQCKVSS
jgi:hypothetical protein